MRDLRQEVHKRQVAKLFALALLMLPLAPQIRAKNQPVATQVAELLTTHWMDDLALSPDGAFLATHGPGDGVKIWEVSKQRLIFSRPENGFVLGEHHVDFSRNGRWMAYCTLGTLAVFSITNGRFTQTALRPPNDTSNCWGVSFSHDSSQLIAMQSLDDMQTGSDLVVYDTTSWRVKSTIRLRPYIGDRKNFDGCHETLTPVGDQILPDPKDAGTFFHPSPDLSGWSLSPDGRFLAISGDKRALCKPPKAVDDRYFIVLNHSVAILDLVDRQFVRVIEGETQSIDWSSNGLQLALGPPATHAPDEATGPIRITNIDSGAPVVTEATYNEHVHLRYTSGGKYLIAAVGKRVEIWDASHAHLLQTIRAEPLCLAVSGNGRYLALGGSPPSLIRHFPLLSIIFEPDGPPGKAIVYRLQ